MTSQLLQEEDEKGKTYKVTWYGRNAGKGSSLPQHQEKMNAKTERFDILPSGELAFRELETEKLYVISQGRYYIREVEQ